MRRRRALETAAARFAESHEALTGLANMAFHAARRTGNDPVSLTTIATDVARYRARIEAAQRWLDAHHPVSGRLYRRAVERVEEDVRPKLALALTPDDRFGPERTVDGSFHPGDDALRIVRLWGLVVRNRTGVRRVLGANARRRLEELVCG